MGKIVFVTGTDTGVGKTLFTASFLAVLRSRGTRAWALKPFCSGPRDDAMLFHVLQDRELPLESVNPIWLRQPLAPLVAARQSRRRIDLQQVIRGIRDASDRCDLLLVEGCGGLLVPITENSTVADLIAALNAPAIVVARNKLGVINHTLLTLDKLSRSNLETLAVVLMGTPRGNLAAKTNRKILAELVKPITVFELKHLGRDASRPGAVKANLKKMEKLLAPLLKMDILSGV